MLFKGKYKIIQSFICLKVPHLLFLIFLFSNPSVFNGRWNTLHHAKKINKLIGFLLIEAVRVADVPKLLEIVLSCAAFEILAH